MRRLDCRLYTFPLTIHMFTASIKMAYLRLKLATSKVPLNTPAFLYILNNTCQFSRKLNTSKKSELVCYTF